MLLQGGSIEKPVHEDITYEDIHKTLENLWNFLFFTGYLKMVSQRFEGEDIYLTMTIPNVEVRSIYRRTIAEWFEASLKTADRTPLQQALLAGDCEALTLLIDRQLMSGISYYDNLESFYHGYLLGMLQDVPDYFTYSNREAGNGRPDLQLISADRKMPAIVIEIKRADSYAGMETLCEQALAQIQEQQYTAELRLQGYQNFWYYGVCFCKKSCKILCEKDDV